MKQFFVLLLLFCSGLYAQELTPIDTTSYEQRTYLLEQYEGEFEDFNRGIRQQYRSALRKELTGIYESTQEEFIRMIRNREFIFDSRYAEYISQLSSQIKTNLKGENISDFRILLSRSNEPNAFCMPDGTIVINIGLFRFLSNEEQLISVICHEISHNELKHPSNGALEKAKISSSKALRENVRSISAKKRNQNQQAFAILKDILYNQGAKRRDAEQEADSLGYLLYRKMTPKHTEFVNALYFIKEFDSLPKTEFTTDDYRRVFDLPELPFNENWLEMEDYSQYNYDFYNEKINKDSIRSHPEMEDRIAKLKTDFQGLNDINGFEDTADSTTTFYQLKRLARQEVIHNFYNSEEYGLSIYVTLARLKEDPENIWLKKWLGKNFTKLYEAKKAYTLNKYVSHQNPKIEDESYLQFLAFIWNLRVKELKAIGDYYSSIE